MGDITGMIDSASGEFTDRLRRFDPEGLTIPEVIGILKICWYSKDSELVKPFIENLMRRFSPLLKKHYVRLNGLGVGFEEFQGDVIIKLYKSLPSLNEPKAFPGFFSKLVNSVTSNLVKNRLTIRDRNGGFEGGNCDFDRESLQKEGESKFEREIVMTIMLDELQRKHNTEFSERERKILSLIRQDETTEEIAKHLGISVNYVRNLKSAVLKKIREILSDERWKP